MPPGSVPLAVIARRRLAGAAATWEAVAVVGLLVVGAAVVLHVGRGTSFFFDEWDWIQGRRNWNADALLAPHNGHLSLVPVLVLKVLFETVGLGNYLPYRLAVLVLHLAVALLLYTYARRRVGVALAFAAAVTLLFLGPAWMDLLWPLQIGYLASLFGGLGALVALDRDDRRGDLVAAGLLSIALASSSLGLPVLGALAVDVFGRADRRRRWPVVAGPATLYAAWYLGYGTTGEATVDNLFATPAYVADAAAAAVAALFGVGAGWGPPLTVGLIALLAVRVRPIVTVPWRLAALATGTLLFWGLTGLGRAHLHEPGASRYLYPGVLFILLIAAEAVPTARPATRRPVGTGATWSVVALLLAATVSHLGELRDGGRQLRDLTIEVRGALTATEVGGRRLPAGFQPAPSAAPQIRAGPYLAAVADLGSPIASPADLPGDDQRARHSADRTLIRGYGIVLARSDPRAGSDPQPAEPIAVEAADGALIADDADCVAARPTQPGATITVIAPNGGLVLENVTTVRVRRWSDAVSDPISAPQDGAGPLDLRIPPDDDPTPWLVEIPVGDGVTVCPLVG